MIFMTTDSPNLAERPLVFIHIPKTAGTTINFGLRQAFPDESVFHLQRRNDEELATLAADQALKAYAGHVAYGQAARAFASTGRRPHYVTVLREPVERILSAYSYAKGTPKERWHKLANDHDINAFVALMKKQQPQFLTGKQCRYLCPDGSVDAHSAFHSLQANFRLVGLQRQLDLFFTGLEALAGRELPRPKKRNQSLQRVERDSLDNKTLKILEKATQTDRQLYDLALAWLSDRRETGGSASGLDGALGFGKRDL